MTTRSLSAAAAVILTAWLAAAASLALWRDPPPAAWQTTLLAAAAPAAAWLLAAAAGAVRGASLLAGPAGWAAGLALLLASDADSVLRVRLAAATGIDRLRPNPAVAPVPHDPARHDALKRSAPAASVVFLGDSLTARWLREGRPAWDARLAPRGAAAFGVGGDRTQNLLWRLRDGELDGLRPRAVVVLVGTNNLGRDPDDRVAAGVAAVLDELKLRLPDAAVILLGLFPRGPAGDPVRGRVAAVNRLLEGVAAERGAAFADLGDAFLTPGGEWQPGVTTDGLHLTAAGYELWAAAVGPLVDAFLDPP